MSKESLSLIKKGFDIELSASQAGLLLREHRYPRQKRDKEPSGIQHIKNLADYMARRQWRIEDKLDFAHHIPTNETFIINGHHRLGAQALSGMTMKWVMSLHECLTMEEVDTLYISFDTNTRIRGAGTVIDAVRLPNRLGVTRATSRKLWNALPLIACHFDTACDEIAMLKKATDRKVSLAQEYQEEIHTWEVITSEAPYNIKTKLGSQGALAVALITIRYQPREADNFWRGIATNDGLKRGDPRHTYLRYLNDEFRSNVYIANPIIRGAMYAARAWNAWLGERTVSFLRVANTDQLFIDGTPYDEEGMAEFGLS